MDDALARLGLRRRVAVNLPHWPVVPEVLRGTDRAAEIPHRLAEVLARPADGFAWNDLPLPEAEFGWSPSWHRRQEGSARHAWLRGLVAGAVRGDAEA